MTEKDKQALLAKLHEMGGCDAPPDTWARGYDDAIDEVYKMVEALPAAAPPKRGDEYIDKAVAINIMNARADMAVCSGAEKYFFAAARMIELLPGADVAPVRHGCWNYKHRYRGGFRERIGTDLNGDTHTILCDERIEVDDPYCSACGRLNESVWRAYCPNCGAKMDGGEK